MERWSNARSIVIDGRNRREVCRLVKVEPTTVQLERDLVAYISSANINRRHLTKGQRAMAVAKILPQKGHGQTARNLGFTEERLRQARTVLQFAPDHADAVLTGSMRWSARPSRACTLRAWVVAGVRVAGGGGWCRVPVEIASGNARYQTRSDNGRPLPFGGDRNQPTPDLWRFGGRLADTSVAAGKPTTSLFLVRGQLR
jgi:hypothetical protein